MRRRELKVSLGGSLGPAAFCTKGHGSSEPPLCISSIDAVHIVPVSDTEWRDQPWRMAIRRTGRLLAPSTLVTNSTLPGRPPQPSWRMRAMMSRISMSPRAARVSDNIRSLPQRTQVTRMNHDGKVRNGSPRASWPVGSGRSPPLPPTQVTVTMPTEGHRSRSGPTVSG